MKLYKQAILLRNTICAPKLGIEGLKQTVYHKESPQLLSVQLSRSIPALWKYSPPLKVEKANGENI